MSCYGVVGCTLWWIRDIHNSGRSPYLTQSSLKDDCERLSQSCQKNRRSVVELKVGFYAVVQSDRAE